MQKVVNVGDSSLPGIVSKPFSGLRAAACLTTEALRALTREMVAAAV